jgi:DnaJ-class molecular chaperone
MFSNDLYLVRLPFTAPPRPPAAGPPRPGRDLSTVLGIELQDAASGCEQAVRVKALKRCTICKVRAEIIRGRVSVVSN